MKSLIVSIFLLIHAAAYGLTMFKTQSISYPQHGRKMLHESERSSSTNTNLWMKHQPTRQIAVMRLSMCRYSSNRISHCTKIQPSNIRSPCPRANSRSMQLNMVFDFLKKRSEEGFAQIQNIATKTVEGKLGEALSESADYIKRRQKIDAENLRRLTDGLAKSRDRLLGGISNAFKGGDNMAIEARLEKIEEVLLQADIGATTTTTILNDLRTYARIEGLKEDDILPVLRARLIEALSPDTHRGINFVKENEGPTIIFVIGANGMGKTTTIGKIASRLQNEANMTVLLGACDTFRAAAVEQLGEWAIRANVSIVKPFEDERGGDPVPVVRRTVKKAIEDNVSVCIIDTSGRLSNNFELIEQLQNMKKAIQEEIPSAPHETLLVVDGSVGRNAVEQANAWRKYVGVSGLVITKLDGTARGGFVVSVVRDLGLPVKFIGVGEKIEDLRDFDPEVFVDALLGNNEKQAQALKIKANKMFNVLPPAPLTSTTPNTVSGNTVKQSSNPSLDRLKQSFSASKKDEKVETLEQFKPARPKRVKPQKTVKKSKK